MTVASPVILEPAAQQVADAFSRPPFLYEMAPADARKVLADAQSGPVSMPPVDEEWITVPSPAGDVRVRIIKPQGAAGMLPVIVYMHGGGWILGNAQTHDRLVRELAVGAGAALAFVEYPNSPEARYPTAIEQGYATAQWITRNGAAKGRRIGGRQHGRCAGTDGQAAWRCHLRAAVDVLPGHRRGDEHRLL
jgi:acetyl esterase/lipase